jgi:hypothetical protein
VALLVACFDPALAPDFWAVRDRLDAPAAARVRVVAPVVRRGAGFLPAVPGMVISLCESGPSGPEERAIVAPRAASL